jgi:integrase
MTVTGQNNSGVGSIDHGAGVAAGGPPLGSRPTSPLAGRGTTLPTYRFHDLRHAHATRLLAVGALSEHLETSILY